MQWCGSDFDGLIVFDECHRAKNLCPVGSSKPTKTGKVWSIFLLNYFVYCLFLKTPNFSGLTVLELQNKLPLARVVYASATGASEPRNMAYMVRLGLWGEGTPFKEFADFISAVEKRGVGAMEIVAMDMKLRGMYIGKVKLRNIILNFTISARSKGIVNKIGLFSNKYNINELSG